LWDLLTYNIFRLDTKTISTKIIGFGFEYSI